MTELYKQQVKLLITILPEVAKEKNFALHGGTAINLFIRDLPRLSVDIDLTYIPIEDRATSLKLVEDGLKKIRANIEKVIRGVRIAPRYDVGKLQISAGNVEVKLEVNLVNRGTITEPVEMPLCEKAQKEFEAFCEVPIVPVAQLFGGKIIAALDRQHPRDLFDVKYLLDKEDFTQDIKQGFLFSLLCSARPMNEIIAPNLQDQRAAMVNQFSGMTDEAFTYEEYETIRQKLVTTVHQQLTNKDREFLLSFKNLEPDWSVHNFERFPSIQWKLQNLQQLKEKNPDKHQKQFNILKKVLGK